LSSFNSFKISTSSKTVLFPILTTFENPSFFSKAQSVVTTAIAPLCETILIFHFKNSLVQKLKFKSLCGSQCHKQFGPRSKISFSKAILFILSSSSIFPSSLNPAVITIALFIHLFAVSNNDSSMNGAGVTNTRASTTSGKSVIDL
jgi:hypothetical protein